MNLLASRSRYLALIWSHICIDGRSIYTVRVSHASVHVVGIDCILEVVVFRVIESIYVEGFADRTANIGEYLCLLGREDAVLVWSFPTQVEDVRLLSRAEKAFTGRDMTLSIMHWEAMFSLRDALFALRRIPSGITTDACPPGFRERTIHSRNRDSRPTPPHAYFLLFFSRTCAMYFRGVPARWRSGLPCLWCPYYRSQGMGDLQV